MKSNFPETGKRITTFPNVSLQQRIPLLICLLLVGVVSVFILVSYISLKNFELKASKQRLVDLTAQVSTMLGESIQDIKVNTQKIAAAAPVIKYLQLPGKATEPATLEALRSITIDGTTFLVELRDSNFHALLSVGDTLYRSPEHAMLFTTLIDSISTGNIYHIKDSVFYPIAATVKVDDKILGYLIRYRYVRITSKMIEQFSRLAGKGASLYVGNSDQSLWTDLFHPVTYQLPAKAIQQGKSYENVQEDHQHVIGASHYIKGTPWMVILEFSRDVVLQGSTQFLLWLIGMGVLLVALGIAGAWFMSRNLTRPLNILTEAVGSFTSGNYTREVDIHRGDEVGELARSFNIMMSKLQAARKEMEQHIIESEELTVQLRSLTTHLQNIREEERLHIAREMHDELGQLLTSFRMDVHMLKKRIGNTEDLILKENISSMEKSIDESMKFIRKLSSELRAGPLEDLGLVAALDWYCGEFTKRFNIPVAFHTSHNIVSAKALVRTGLFRICQESLTNIARHANASQAAVTLIVKEEMILLTVQDDGVGFETDPPGKRKTLGLIGMHERVLMIGGKLTLVSSPGYGTTIEVTVPFSTDAVK